MAIEPDKVFNKAMYTFCTSLTVCEFSPAFRTSRVWNSPTDSCPMRAVLRRWRKHKFPPKVNSPGVTHIEP